MNRQSRDHALARLGVALGTLLLVLGLELGRAAGDLELSLPVLGDTPSHEDETAVMDLISRFAQAWSRGDAEGVVATFDTDLDWTNAFGRTLRNREQLEAYLGAQFAFPGEEGLAAGELDAAQSAMLRYLGDDVAVLQWIAPAHGRSGRRDTHVTLIARKARGEWYLVSHTATLLRD